MHEPAVLYDRMRGKRDDAYAVSIAKDSLAKQGYIVDKMLPVKASKYGPFWKYEIPVERVTSG